LRPIRPNPLIATRTAIQSLLNCSEMTIFEAVFAPNVVTMQSFES